MTFLAKGAAIAYGALVRTGYAGVILYKITGFTAAALTGIIRDAIVAVCAARTTGIADTIVHKSDHVEFGVEPWHAIGALFGIILNAELAVWSAALAALSGAVDIFCEVGETA